MTTIIKTIQLDAADNVVVCTESLTIGEKVFILNEQVGLASRVGIGHKLACKEIQEGDLIIKYGVAIGTATENIPFGAHVHTHNMKSNYIPTYLID
jgi:hypothetical protein